ncbi:MAG: gamma-glutamyl-gamma-aminobutyrate hydrolase family protein [Woeseiaceae bacterium]|nr:gamma-glutamyl-gamma-aminobutyrate hydrolase family protein [Woeseiaceae bacterium]
MCAKPVIGIPADRRIIEPHPFHAVGEKYITAVMDGAGGLPLLVPALGDALSADDLLEVLDGLFLTGSPSNVEPHHYGGEASRPGTWHDPHRDATNLPLIERALAAGMPLFAVCRGFQELNVVLGGTLHQYVHEVPGYRVHRENSEDPLEVQYGPAHSVTLVENGLLRRLAGVDTVTVNSLHSQAVARLADCVSVEAIAEDGLVEAYRVDDAAGFALAVQWHPEWQVRQNPLSLAMFEAFGAACRDYRAARRPERPQSKNE